MKKHEDMVLISKADLAQLKMLSSNAEDASGVGLVAYETLKGAIDAISMESDHMTNIVDEIGNLILQTRILSLNASVEGARAGESGRAFSTIANEMSHLADSIKENMLAVKKYSTNIVSGVKKSSDMALETEEKIEIVEMSVQLINQFIMDVALEDLDSEL